MSNTLPFVAAYTKASGSQQVKATGLTVTCTVWKIALATGTATELAQGSATELTTNSGAYTSGMYYYLYTGALDFTTYFYAATFTTTDTTVQQVDIAAAWFDFPTSQSMNSSAQVTAASVQGNVTGSVASVSAINTSSGKISEVVLVDTVTTLTGNTPQSGDVYAALSALVTSIVSGVWSAATRTLTAFGINVTVGGYASGQDPATLVLDVAASSHDNAGTIGAKINSAGSAADPLENDVPGSYAQGTAGYALGRIGGLQIVVSGLYNSGPAFGPFIVSADYQTRDNFAVSVTDSNNAWPNLTGAALAFGMNGGSYGTVTCANPGANAQTIQIAFTRTQIAGITPSQYNCLVVATLGNGDQVVLPGTVGTITFQANPLLTA